MFDLFGRYVFRQVATAFLLVLVSLTAIVWIASALKEMDLLTTKGQSLLIFLNITVLVLPNLVAVIAPNALLIASLHTLDRLNGDSELIVVSASGTPVWRIAWPFLAVAALLSLFLVINSFWLQPASMRAMRNYVVQVRTDLISQVLRPGLFSSPDANLTFHIRDRAPNGDLLDLMVHDARDQEQVMTYLAKRGRIVESAAGAFLVMQGGQIHRRNPSGADESTQIVDFEQYVFDLSRFGPKSEAENLKPSDKYMSELLNPDPEDRYYKKYPGSFRAELHDRISNLFYPFAFVMIAVMFLGLPRTARQNRWYALVFAFGLAIAVRLLGLAANNLHTLQPSAIILVYLVPIGVILVAALVAQVRMAPRRRPKWELGLERVLGFLNYNAWLVRGMPIARRRGRVG